MANIYLAILWPSVTNVTNMWTVDTDKQIQTNKHIIIVENHVGVTWLRSKDICKEALL